MEFSFSVRPTEYKVSVTAEHYSLYFRTVDDYYLAEMIYI